MANWDIYSLNILSGCFISSKQECSDEGLLNSVFNENGINVLNSSFKVQSAKQYKIKPQQTVHLIVKRLLLHS